MNLEVLISAMNLKNTQIIEKTRCHTDVLIINQTNENCYFEFTNDNLIRMISTTERGLAKSRNLALKNAQGDICLICDDDEELVNDYDRIIINAFEQFPEADVIAFDFKKKSRNNRYKKRFGYGESKISRIAPYFKTYASVQLAFKRKSIIEKKILFDERFGAGSNFISSGEETVWQVKLKKAGAKIYYVPRTICYIRQDKSEWFKGLNERYYYDLGACLGFNYSILGFLLMFYYVFCIEGTSLTVFEQIKWLYSGIVGFNKFKLTYDAYSKLIENKKIKAR